MSLVALLADGRTKGNAAFSNDSLWLTGKRSWKTRIGSTCNVWVIKHFHRDERKTAEFSHFLFILTFMKQPHCDQRQPPIFSDQQSEKLYLLKRIYLHASIECLITAELTHAAKFGSWRANNWLARWMEKFYFLWLLLLLPNNASCSWQYCLWNWKFFSIQFLCVFFSMGKLDGMQSK